MSVQDLNPEADVIGQKHALMTNVAASISLANIIKTNLGPKGTLKMLVGGAGDVKITKDGKVLLDQMQIQHPTAMLIARTATAQDDITGDGTTSNVLFTGELMRQAERILSDGLHPRQLVEGIEKAREEALDFLEKFKVPVESKDDSKASEGEDGEGSVTTHQIIPAVGVDREILENLARTSLRTKVHRELADHLTGIVVGAVQTIQQPNKPIDLHMVEIMHMAHQTAMDTRFIPGLVLDHGARHPNMKRRVENAFILTCNVSLEYEKSEVNAGFFYKDATEREALVAAERKFTDDKVRQIIAFKQRVCSGENKDRSFVVINQKGIDPPSLDLLQKEGIVALRRAKRRNMERLARSCGGYAVNSLEDIEEKCLGFAELVYEHTLGDDKFTFVEGCRNPTSCTILIKGPNAHTIRQVKDAIRDGLRAVSNLLEDRSMLPGAGAFEVACAGHLHKWKSTVSGRAKLGVHAFAEALMVIPKTLAENSGLDATDAVLTLMEEQARGNVVGLDIDTGRCINPAQAGIWDNYRVKKQFIHLGSMVATKLLLVDEVIRAGRKMGKGGV